MFEENAVREITRLSRLRRLRKASFSKCFPSTRKRKAFGLKNVSEKLRFRDVLVWMVGLTVEIKLRFQISLA